MATLLKTDGTREVNVNIDTLKRKQELVGGLIELVHINEGRVLIVNEEGLIHRLPLNHQATGICGHPIVGDVILCNTNDIN